MAKWPLSLDPLDRYAFVMLYIVYVNAFLNFTVDTQFSSNRLQSVVHDSDLLAGRDFEPLTHRAPCQLTATENDVPLKITTSPI